MTRSVIPALAAGLLLPASAFAQQLPPATQTRFVGPQNKTLPTAEGALYREQTEYQDSVQGVVRTFYPGGAKRSVVPYEHLRKGTAHGTAEDWYESGQLSWQRSYGHGKPDGPATEYYPSGSLKSRRAYVAGQRQGEWEMRYPDGGKKRREVFVQDERMVAECFDAQGRAVPFFEYEVMPVFPGGQDALLRFIGSQTRYPAQALRQHIEGRVFVSFWVDSTGQVTQVQLAKGVHPLLDEEALRVVQSLPRFEPGRQDGRPVAVSFTVPMGFAIRDNKSSRPQRGRPAPGQ